ncbi:hypothetical protein KY5_4656c [Streptomyces formicae]|uniref:Lipoprotein n=2 Tax=Streptomyces formicae TaxID=1616117 RepID=A0A291QDW9_9ACTN|nr:hypothetical protein KY5_4656c [Streptomyces formicae]
MPTIAVLAATTALVLTGCSSNSDASDKIEGAGGDANASPKSPEKSSTAPAELPDFGLPADVKVEIASDTTGDKAKDRILKEQAESLMARQRIFLDLDPKSRYLTRYYADEALAFYVSEIKKAKADNRTITGLYRYYDRKVETHTGDIAVVSYCEDRSKAYAKDITSGKTRKTEPSPSDFIKNTATLAKTGNGTWVVQSFRGKTSAKECQ